MWPEAALPQAADGRMDEGLALGHGVNCLKGVRLKFKYGKIQYAGHLNVHS